MLRIVLIWSHKSGMIYESLFLSCVLKILTL